MSQIPVATRLVAQQLRRLLQGNKTYTTLAAGFALLLLYVSNGDFVSYAKHFAENPDPGVIAAAILSAVATFTKAGLNRIEKKLSDKEKR